YALVILFVKDLYSRAALEANRALIGPETLLLSLQNGMGNEEIMREFAAPERILLGTTKHNCVTREAGVIYHSGAGITHLGSPAGNRAAAETVAALFNGCGLEADVIDSVKHLLWEKLFVNMTINPLTALTDAPIGAIATDPNLRELARALIDEATAVAAADGEQFDAQTVFSALLRTAETLSTGKASMCQDLERKRRTEIDFINGAVVRLGQKYHVPTPRHEVIVSLVHAKEG
ncbi:MAG TPA: 2-dehydropantoate 2-reductase, partial [Clostridiales bacterium]|nr:2-dehydropantoate 2-reductase [Clostridiales bacterium]